MSNTISISTNTDEFVALDISTKYKELVRTALDSEGIYIRTKETLEELFENKTLTAKEKSELIANVLGNLNNSIVSGAMQTALAWAAKDKELTLNKIELEYKLALINQQTESQKQSVKTEFANTAARNAELLKNYGVLVSSEGVVTDSGTDGKIDKEMALLDQERVNKVAEASVLGSKLKESQASTHRIMADTHENYGYYTYNLTDNGASSITKISTHTSLSDAQKKIAQEQAKGYAWNAWTSGAQGSASMIGSLVAAEVPGLTDYLAQWSATVTKITDIEPPTF